MKPHPWNTGFAWQRPTDRSYRVVDGDQADQFHKQGFVLVEGAFRPGELDEVTAALDLIEARADTFLRSRPAARLSISETGAIVFAPHAVLVAAAARRFAAHPVFTGLCHDLIGDDVRLYWDQLVYKKTEKPREFPWHQDNGYTYVEPQQYLTCWVPLTDATLENGCPWVMPGLHLGGTLHHTFDEPLGYRCLYSSEGAAPVEARAGSVVVFSSLTPHRTGPNVTDSVRRTYILQYAPEGAEMLRGNPVDGPPRSRDLQNNPDRQFPVLVDGEAVANP